MDWRVWEAAKKRLGEAAANGLDAMGRAASDPLGTVKGAVDATLEAGQQVVDATGKAIDKVRSDKPK